MHRNGLHYKKTRHIPAKADTEKQREWDKEKPEPAIKDAQNGACHLLFVDAAHFILQPFICALWCSIRLFNKAASARNRLDVLGSVNATTGFFQTVNQKHTVDLTKLLTLNFQFFENKNAEIYPVEK